MKKHVNKQNNESAVKVLIRVRPLISIQYETRSIVTIGIDQKSVVINIDNNNQIQTSFDKVIGPQKNQRQMFQNIQPYIDRVLDGYNMTIFAYGQTGSGKTYTMFGKDWQNSFQQLQKSKKSIKQKTPLTDVTSDDNFSGLIPRSAYHLFSCISMYPDQYKVYCSFLQIYNQKVYDLLQDSPIPNPLNIHQSKFEGIFVEGLGQFQVHEYTDCLQLIRRGQKNRFIRQTSMNAKSSRSHTIFQLLIQSSKMDAKGVYKRAKLNLCDLAGSQKVNKMEVMNKQHMDELKNINLSLSTLGKVINALSKSSKNMAFFRESKLTRLLQQSLIGNTNTFIVGAISCSSKNKDQTLNTLKFVQRAKHIKLNIKPSNISNQSGEVVLRLQQQMQQLRKILREKQKTAVPKSIQQKLIKLQQENAKLKNQTQDKNENIQKLLSQNREIKQALYRMQRAAIQQLSNASFYMSQDKKSYDDYKSKMKQSIKHYEPIDENKYQPSSRYSISRNQYLPPISGRLNRSLDIRQEATITRPGMKVDARGKKVLINRLEALQNMQKKRQSKLINDLQFYQNKQRVQSEHIKKSKKLVQPPSPVFQTLDEQSFKVKPHRKLDFAQKIKQLQSRLKKFNR